MSATVRWLLIALILLCLAGGLVIWWAKYATYHFAVVQAGALYRDGNRGLRELAAACRRGEIRTIISLADDQEITKPPFSQEADFCRRNGIQFQRIPVVVGQRPGTEHVRRFLEIATQPANQPVLVHCAQGVRRTAMLVAAYQQSVMGFKAEQAKEAILLWGRKPASLDDVRGFIDDYDAKSRFVGEKHVVFRAQDKD